MGLRSLEDGYTPPILDITQLDRKVLVSNAEAVTALRKLLALEGVFAGVSAGAALAVARRIAAEMEGGNVVVRVRRRRLEVPVGGHLHEARRPARPRDGRARLVVIPAAVRDEIVAHARAGLPNEACGILAGRDGRVERFFPARARRAEPVLLPDRVARPDPDHERDRRRRPRPARHLPLAHELAGLPVAHRRRAGLLARRGLRDRLARGRRPPTCAATASHDMAITEEALRVE